MLKRCLRIVRFDRTVFDEIAADPAGTVQASLVVLIALTATGVGGGVLMAIYSWLVSGLGASQSVSPSFWGYLPFMLISMVGVLIRWPLTAWLGSAMGRGFFHGQGSVVGLLRAVGYAQVPMVLSLIGFLPVIGSLGSTLGGGLATVATILGIQRVMRVNLGEAVLCWLVPLVVASIVTGAVFIAGHIPLYARMFSGMFAQ